MLFQAFVDNKCLLKVCLYKIGFHAVCIRAKIENTLSINFTSKVICPDVRKIGYFSCL